MKPIVLATDDSPAAADEKLARAPQEADPWKEPAITTPSPVRRRPRMFWTRKYWLEHCEGYRVETPEGHLGFVEELMGEPESAEPVTLLVRWCRGDSGLTAVPIERVSEVRPEAEVILVLNAPTDELGKE